MVSENDRIELDNKPLPVDGLSDEQIADVLVFELKQIEDQDSKTLFCGTEELSVADLIDHIKNKTEKGLEHIEMRKKVQETLERLT